MIKNIPRESVMQKTIKLATIVLLLTVSSQLRAQEKDQKESERTPQEQQAIEQIRELGGSVLEVAQNDNRLDVAYHLADGKVEDKHLEPLKNAKSVYSLNLRCTDVTDAGLANLKGLNSLVKLHLEKTKVTDKGLANLKGLSNLEYLNVYGTQVTDKGLEQLTSLKKLKKDLRLGNEGYGCGNSQVEEGTRKH